MHFRSSRAALVLGLTVAIFLLGSGCGGGGGGPEAQTPPFSDSDLQGGWHGPTGPSNVSGSGVGAGTGGMFADAQGNILDLPRNGMVTGVTARVALVDAWNGVWSFTDSMSRKSLLVMSTDKMHLLYVNDQFDLGAWERGTSTLSSPYTLADIAPSDWAGSVIGISASFELASLGPVHDANIDPVGNFQELTSVTKLTDLAPLALLEPANGQFDGDFKLEGAAATGRTLTLVTPDSHFLVVQTCPVGGTFPVDCRFSAWQRR